MFNQRYLKTATAAIAFWASFASTDAFAAEPSVNLGGTSFMDGFGDTTGYGLSYQNYVSFARSTSMKDATGNANPMFADPKLNAFVDLNQFVYNFKMPDSAFAQRA